MKRIYPIIFLAILILLAACSLTARSAFLDDTTCELPCWRGISMGDDQEEVIRKLNSMEDIKQESIKIEDDLTNVSLQLVSWDFVSVQETGGAILFSDKKMIRLNSGYQDWLGLQYFIEKYGEPDLVEISTSNLLPLSLNARFLYSKKGLCLEMRVDQNQNREPGDDYTFDRRTPIRSFIMIDPSIENGQLELGCLRGMSEAVYEANTQEWTGYGAYHVHVSQ